MRLYFTSWNIANLEYSLKHTSELNNPKEVEFRVKTLKFWSSYGIKAAIEYSGRSKSTLYNWKKSLELSRRLDRTGKASLYSLDPKSRRPNHIRQAKYNKTIKLYVIRILNKYPFLGRRKVYYLLKHYISHESGTAMVSTSTVGRLIKLLRGLNRIPSKGKVSFYARSNTVRLKLRKSITKLRRGCYKVKQPGDLIQIDGIIINTYKKHRYILNCIDYKTGIATSRLLNNGKSLSTANFLEELPSLFGFPIKAIQTDNGTEFMANFHDRTKDMGITHFFNYVRQPKYNGKVERFNRTIQEELLNDPDMLLDLCDNPLEAQRKIDNYINWYNYKRPHQSLNYQTPNEFLLQCV